MSKSTDMRFNVIPEKPAGYVLPTYVLPPSFDIKREREEFAREAFRKKLSLKEAEDGWDSFCREIIRKDDQKTESALRSRDSQYGSDFEMTPLEARREINRILNEKSHAYHDAMSREHEEAKCFMNRLHEIERGEKTNFGGYLNDLEAERRAEHVKNYGPKSSSNSLEESDLHGTRFTPKEPRLEQPAPEETSHKVLDSRQEEAFEDVAGEDTESDEEE